MYPEVRNNTEQAQQYLDTGFCRRSDKVTSSVGETLLLVRWLHKHTLSSYPCILKVMHVKLFIMFCTLSLVYSRWQYMWYQFKTPQLNTNIGVLNYIAMVVCPNNVHAV